MSKWIDGDLFNKFQETKKSEADDPGTGGVRRSDFVWQTPERGTTDKPKNYEGRFLPDKKMNFYKKYFYHMFQSGEKWMFSLCPKTFDFNNYCPLCSVTSKLYMGTAADKKAASSYRRKEKFVGNFYIVKDPRDAERDEDDKVNGTIRLYEFPGKVEMKLKEEITDTTNGLGGRIFDPGENGHNFILKVLSTKKDKFGNVWPDYSSSTFARRSSPIGSDKEIDDIMKTTFDLNEYVESMRIDDDDVVALLKAEMLWDLVKDEWEKNKNVAAVSKEPDDLDDSQWDNQDSSDTTEETPEGDLSDEELLKELAGL
jgi:hypothetical protein